MKINESFGPPSENDVVDETRRMESEVLTQLKSEFLEFVTQTRERLRLVSESLSELDREYMIQPQIIDQPVSVAEQLEAEPIVETEATPIQSETPEPTFESDSSVETDDTPVISRDLRYVAIGASTGGPGAIFDMLAAIGRRPKLGFAVVQHIADGFEPALTEWLTAELGIDVAVARHGEHLEMGMVRIAPGDHHLSIERGGKLVLDRHGAPVGGHRPSVEVLFKSLLEQPTQRVAAVLLSGMGSDGAAAMAELRAANVLTVAQDEGSCAVFGMPRAAIEGRAAALALAPSQIGRLLARVRGGQR